MKTIDNIIKDAGYTKKFLLECRKSGRTNGMGGKGGIQWTKEARKLKYFNSKKEKELLDDLDLVSDIHDLSFEKGVNIIDFLKANKNLSLNIISLLHWTSIYGRISIFLLVFLGTSTLGIKYFNWGGK